MATNSAASRSLGEFLAGRVIDANPRRNRYTLVSTARRCKSCTPEVLLEAPNEGSRPLSGRRGIIKQCLSSSGGIDISDGQGQGPEVIGRPSAPVHIAARLGP